MVAQVCETGAGSALGGAAGPPGARPGPVPLAALTLAPARRELLAQALQEAQRYHSIVEHLTELVCRFLPDGTLTFANQAYFRLLRRPPSIP